MSIYFLKNLIEHTLLAINYYFFYVLHTSDRGDKDRPETTLLSNPALCAERAASVKEQHAIILLLDVFFSMSAR